MRYLHKFETTSEFETQYNGGGYHEPWVSLTEENDEVNYNKKKYEPLTFNILSDGNIGWKIGSGSTERTIQYSKNGGEWTDITSTTGGTAIQVVTGDVLRFKGDTWPGSAYDNYSQFTSTCTFAASGNPGSLKYGEVTYGDEPLAKWCYYRMFYGGTGLTTAPVLPATTLASHCYNSMFYGCTSLTSTPELPATTLANYCYLHMFQDCTSLTTAPELPATALTDSCYCSMFEGCTSLTTAPELPATTLKSYCYNQMFSGCINLTNAPELPATTLEDSCYYKMFQGCAGLTSAPELPATTSADFCYQEMFKDCSSLTTAPELPATTLSKYCYYAMFSGCAGLTSAPELPATKLVFNCYAYMFSSCSKLNYVRCLATDISASNALENWLYNVSSTGTFYRKTGVTYALNASGIPAGWTIVDV